jgi:hypothetical protein
MAIAPQAVLNLVHLRRNLKGTLTTALQALEAVEGVLAALNPKCKTCLFEQGLVEECRCDKKGDQLPKAGATPEKLIRNPTQ